MGERNLAVRVTRDAERWLRGGSPWLYEGSITSLSHEGQAGDLAVVFDHDRRFLAIGLFDPDSPIRIKVLHVGRPVDIDADFWRGRVDAAFTPRRELIDNPDTTGYRCIHGENDGLPGLIVDRYNNTLVAKLYSAAWWPHLAVVAAALVERMPEVHRVVVRLARSVSPWGDIADGTVVYGDPLVAPIRFLENGLEMEADVIAGQKTGHFLDQRDNRSLVGSMATGRRVLDVFASTGGFSLAAAAGGATSVHLVDLSAPALATAQRNLAHNQHLTSVRATDVRTTIGDAFEVLTAFRASGTRFDLVVVDPPSFAHNQASVDKAVGAYRRLSELAVAVTEPGGTLVQCSCSSRVSEHAFAEAIHTAAQRVGRPLREFRRTGHAVDHPIGFEHGAYLNAIFATV